MGPLRYPFDAQKPADQRSNLPSPFPWYETWRSAALRAAVSESTKSLVRFKRKKQKKSTAIAVLFFCSPARACTGMDIEPTTPCPACRAINPSALRYAPDSWDVPTGCYLLSIRSRCSNSIEKIKTKKGHALRDLFHFELVVQKCNSNI